MVEHELDTRLQALLHMGRRVYSSLPIQGVQLIQSFITIFRCAPYDQYLSPAPTPPAFAVPGTTLAIVPDPSAVAEAVYGSPLTTFTCVVLEVTVVPGAELRAVSRTWCLCVRWASLAWFCEDGNETSQLCLHIA